VIENAGFHNMNISLSQAFTVGKMKLSTRFLTLLLLFALPSVESDIGADGLCTLFTFVPFTFGYV
jgi:hypothetical protein